VAGISSSQTPLHGRTQPDVAPRDRAVRRVLWVEAGVNSVVILAKTTVGVTTGATVVLGDAIHSLADLANNGIALLASRIAATPPDPEHPYGHRKFETLAVFVLAALLAVLAVEISLHALTRDPVPVIRHSWGLALLVCVMGINAGLSLWQSRWAARLDSDLLRADARHTASDVLTTLTAIVGWQLAAAGHTWIDRIFTLGIAGLILYLAFDLFRRAVPVLVDESAADPGELADLVESVPGVVAARRIRSQHGAGVPRVDAVVSVDPDLPTHRSHAIADAIERVLYQEFGVGDVTVHVEPHAASSEPERSDGPGEQK
jgi:cation diffusion facilitator family transporter